MPQQKPNMKRAGWIFILAVLLPVLALAALALRAARNERAFLERQREEIARAQVALIVRDAESELAQMRQEFMAIYREVDFNTRDAAAIEFGCREFKKSHPFARLIFVLDRDGTILWTFAPPSDAPVVAGRAQPALVLSGFVSGADRGTIELTLTGGTLTLAGVQFDLSFNPTAMAAAAFRRDAHGALSAHNLRAASATEAWVENNSSRGLTLTNAGIILLGGDLAAGALTNTAGAIVMKSLGTAPQIVVGSGGALITQSAAPAMFFNTATVTASSGESIGDDVGSISALAETRRLGNLRLGVNRGNEGAGIVNSGSMDVQPSAETSGAPRLREAAATLTFAARAAAQSALPARPLEQQGLGAAREKTEHEFRKSDAPREEKRQAAARAAPPPPPRQQQQPAQQQQQDPQQPQQPQLQIADEAAIFRQREQQFLWNRDTITAYLRAEQNPKQSALSTSKPAQKTPPKSEAPAAAQPRVAEKPLSAPTPTSPVARPAPPPPVVGNELAKAATPDLGGETRDRDQPATLPHPEPAAPPAELEKTAPDYAQHAVPVETKLQPQLPANVSGFNAPVIAVPASFQDFIALGQHYIPRVTDNQLSLLLYARDPDVPDRIVGCEVNLDELKARLQKRLASRGWAADMCAAILDDRIRPVALSLQNFTTDFRRPLVSEPLSEALPHWEAAIYSTRPAQLASTARWVSWTVALLVLTCLAVIFVGLLLVWREAARERRLAQQKADFVTNVTHELQTPLANIRLFSEMLGSGGAPPEKQNQYANVLVAESERLSRLINNVLDFARSGEQRRRSYQMQWTDAGAFVGEIVEMQRPRLENNGFTVTTELPDASLTVNADREALTLAVLNLISNAEKYSGDRKEIAVRARQVGNQVEIAVLDRGVGVPAAERERIFEPFYRAHDQLNSGTSGAGLGLTLARRIARDHGGELRYAPRDGGGSEFVMSLPLV
jgi:signal transduction histidine kinase